MLITNFTENYSPYKHFDLLIVGAGPVGQTLACLLKTRESTRKFRVGLIDQRKQGVSIHNNRILALSEGSKQILSSFCSFEKSNSIGSINVSSSNQFGETLLHTSDVALPELGCVVNYQELSMSLDRHISTFSRIAISTQNIELEKSKNLKIDPKLIFFETTKVIEITEENNKVLVSCQNNEKKVFLLTANLVICAEGQTNKDILSKTKNNLSRKRKTEAPKKFDIVENHFDYEQTAITATVLASAPQKETAFEHFTKNGAIALLPITKLNIPVDSFSLKSTRNYHKFTHNTFPSHFQETSVIANYALIWSNTNSTSKHLLELDNNKFIDALHTEFGFRLGCITQISERSSFNLKLIMKNNRPGKNIIAIGNAAQTIHPITGQGLNLGLRDALALSRCLAEFGICNEALEEYQKIRHKDRIYTKNFTDFFAQGFQYKNCSLSKIKGKLIFALNFFPTLKSLFMRQMIFGVRD